jgi:hypothetical protein
LKVLVEGANAIEERDVMERKFEQIVAEVFQQQRAQVFLTVGWNLELFVVKFSGGWSKLSLFLLYLLPLALLLALTH